MTPETSAPLRRITISEARGGHDGVANGGHYGGYTELFGIFPDEAVVLHGEKPGAIHSYAPGRLNFHYDEMEIDFSIDESKLRPGDFIASRRDYAGQFLVRTGPVEILAHRLPLATPPPTWVELAGEQISESNGYGEKTSWTLGETSDFDEIAAKLQLHKQRHPYGWLWTTSDGKPVAVSAIPRSRWGDNYSHEYSATLGNRDWFETQGLEVREKKENYSS